MFIQKGRKALNKRYNNLKHRVINAQYSYLMKLKKDQAERIPDLADYLTYLGI